MNNFELIREGYSVILKSKDPQTAGQLKISFTEEVLSEDLEESPVIELINDLSETVNNTFDCSIRLVGNNEFLLTRRYALNLSGGIHLDNVKIINPNLHNVWLCDFTSMGCSDTRLHNCRLINLELKHPGQVVEYKYCSTIKNKIMLPVNSPSVSFNVSTIEQEETSELSFWEYFNYVIKNNSNHTDMTIQGVSYTKDIIDGKELVFKTYNQFGHTRSVLEHNGFTLVINSNRDRKELTVITDDRNLRYIPYNIGKERFFNTILSMVGYKEYE